DLPPLQGLGAPNVRSALRLTSGGERTTWGTPDVCCRELSRQKEHLGVKVFLTSYATERFESVRRDLNASAIQWAIANILSFTQGDLHATAYYQQNRGILDEVCGAGYWAWKPFF